eukprot:jgi/Botrbrau1/13667/Bobra.0378s0001.1
MDNGGSWLALSRLSDRPVRIFPKPLMPSNLLNVEAGQVGRSLGCIPSLACPGFAVLPVKHLDHWQQGDPPESY